MLNLGGIEKVKIITYNSFIHAIIQKHYDYNINDLYFSLAIKIRN